MADRYRIRPLVSWTDPVTALRKSSGVFQCDWDSTLMLLRDEVDKLDGEYPVVIQVDADESDIRQDGMLRSRAQVGNPGVVISFSSRYGPLRYASDAYEQRYSSALPGWQANVRAVALALEALRAVDRYGVTKRGEQYTGWKAITGGTGLFSTSDEARSFVDGLWREDFRDAPVPEGGYPAMYRRLATRHHPDVGGEPEIWTRLEAAQQFLAAGGVR